MSTYGGEKRRKKDDRYTTAFIFPSIELSVFDEAKNSYT
jgi:hypothetical protein